MNQVTLTLWGPTWMRGRVLASPFPIGELGGTSEAYIFLASPAVSRFNCGALWLSANERYIGGHGGPITWCTRCSVTTRALLVFLSQRAKSPRHHEVEHVHQGGLNLQREPSTQKTQAVMNGEREERLSRQINHWWTDGSTKTSDAGEEQDAQGSSPW